jgi:hypothetical protein
MVNGRKAPATEIQLYQWLEQEIDQSAGLI